MMADHAAAMPNCEGVRRFMTPVPGTDLFDFTLPDSEVIINHYTTSINSLVCGICMETGARLDNPTCLTCHAVCSNCIEKLKNKCPTCRRGFFVRHRIINPDIERK